MTTCQELKEILRDGLLSFPVTDFDAGGNFDPKGYQARLEWLMPYGARALFAAGGTGEYFSLTLDEFSRVVDTAVRTCQGHTPILAGAGGPTRTAIAFAQEAQRKGAAGILLMPHYLTDAPQEGIARHVREVCDSVDIGVLIYHRGQCRLSPALLEQLAEQCPNLIGFKDGVGNVEHMVRVRRRLGDRFAYLGGLPTAEVFAQAYRAMGVPVYSSAVFNFVPEMAMHFYQAVKTGDDATVGHLLDTFFLPLLEIRNRKPGYAVSIVKAGTRIIGRSSGPVRPPLVDLDPQEEDALRALIEAL
ncbi:5-dehydro-4-deoxyglucarate dehydratase [Castellaniella daejeonensis]|jgi:5-dehydro-4-deoxyglucarate dehydratase|uniref:Probable 5-dehydro-4-deoxyglucarate dehydratase n=1 Tax=Castellaniella daejeonensis TaxID=659013 RepID=A0ABP3DLI5_9BURK|nr:5-dehydro-4-deoxyglucarate dehydratase [Castellaniella sp.]HET8703185.1 5-dehydro-4-deoxyglucarate dehydratase [Castellaniella sp.]